MIDSAVNRESMAEHLTSFFGKSSEARRAPFAHWTPANCHLAPAFLRFDLPVHQQARL